jgi:hypothetical protein
VPPARDEAGGRRGKECELASNDWRRGAAGSPDPYYFRVGGTCSPDLYYFRAGGTCSPDPYDYKAGASGSPDRYDVPVVAQPPRARTASRRGRKVP